MFLVLHGTLIRSYVSNTFTSFPFDSIPLRFIKSPVSQSVHLRLDLIHNHRLLSVSPLASFSSKPCNSRFSCSLLNCWCLLVLHGTLTRSYVSNMELIRSLPPSHLIRFDSASIHQFTTNNKLNHNTASISGRVCSASMTPSSLTMDGSFDTMWCAWGRTNEMSATGATNKRRVTENRENERNEWHRGVPSVVYEISGFAIWLLVSCRAT
jgi:hypothetical protein